MSEKVRINESDQAAYSYGVQALQRFSDKAEGQLKLLQAFNSPP